MVFPFAAFTLWALSVLHWLTVATVTTFKSRTALQAENLALRRQLAVLRRWVKRPKLTLVPRLLWAWLCEAWEPLAILFGHACGSTSYSCETTGLRG
jgi:hypothetical protein